VVTPAQQLMVVVPIDSRLEVEAMVSNRDIGFISTGQQAEVKIDTFNFARYGLLQGKVISVSQDAIVHDKPNQKAGNAKPEGALSDSSEPEGQELSYSARVSLDETRMQIEDKMVNLAPGMAVTVEIKTGTRRIIEYVMSPLLRYRQESLRER
jgi:hemolysin D